MFADINNLTDKGTLIQGRTNSSSLGFFCFWQPKNMFSSTIGLITDIELSEYGYIARALDSCDCIPFGCGQTQEEAYEKMKAKFDKYFDKNGNWMILKYDYWNFLNACCEIDGYIDFINKKEEDFKLFELISKVDKFGQEFMELAKATYEDTKNEVSAKEILEDEHDIIIGTDKILQIVRNKG